MIPLFAVVNGRRQIPLATVNPASFILITEFRLQLSLQ